MIANGDFEDGLKGWRVVSGSAFRGQPVEAATLSAKDVVIDGAPLVRLGGDFWHTPAFPMGQSDKHLIRTVGKPFGVLESDVFTITDPFLTFRLGGSPAAGAAIQLRVPAATVRRSKDFPALDPPDADGFVAVLEASPGGSDILHETTWRLKGKAGTSLVGGTAKVRLQITGPGQHRLLADAIRLEPAPPPPFHPPLWGWADLHCHPMAQAGFGGLLAGHMHGPVEDLGSCLHEHGVNHSDPFRPIGAILDGGFLSDGSLATPGWSMAKPADEEQLGFRGWPAFDDTTHMKVHQDWVKRAWEGGQRLMVALIVHSELLSTVQGAPQSDRDTVEPQIQILKEFVAHNAEWCGLATKPDDARKLIEQNKLAFVLGLETDSINGWINRSDFDPADRVAIHTQLHGYFKYLRGLGVVQINLIHLSDNAFGGMALYDLHFMLNTWARTGQFPDTDPVPPTPDPTMTDDDINCRVTVKSALWTKIEALATSIGWQPLSAAVASPIPPAGDRNRRGLTTAGEEAVLEAMRFGMVIDLDHMSEKSAETAHAIAMKPVPTPYPLVSAHNGARRMAPRPLGPTSPPSPPALPPPPAPQLTPPKSEYRRGEHLWPNENSKSAAQLQFIKETGGMFGHGTAAADSRSWGPVANDCPGSDKTFAQGFHYVHGQLEVPIGLGTDWNSLLVGPGPRFGTRAANGLEGEAGEGDAAWTAAIRGERFDDAQIQTAGVAYSPATPLIDWRDHRFADHQLYKGTALEGFGEKMWQALAVVASGVDLTLATTQTGVGSKLTLAAMGQKIDPDVLDLALGMTGMPSRQAPEGPFHRVGAIYQTAFDRAMEDLTVVALCDGMMAIKRRWDAMTGPNVPLKRAMAGPLRDFDYNLDGLAHYGMFPDMFQDLKNVGFPATEMAALFGSAEKYIAVWEASAAIADSLPHPP
jgi:hypothetical protein